MTRGTTPVPACGGLSTGHAHEGYALAFANGGFRPSLLAPRPGDLKVAATCRLECSVGGSGGIFGRWLRVPLALFGTRWPVHAALLVSVFAFIFGCANQCIEG